MRKMGHFGPKKAQNEKIKNPFFSYPEWVLNPKFRVESLKNGRNSMSDRQTERQTDTRLKEGKPATFAKQLWCFNYCTLEAKPLEIAITNH